MSRIEFPQGLPKYFGYSIISRGTKCIFQLNLPLIWILPSREFLVKAINWFPAITLRMVWRGKNQSFNFASFRLFTDIIHADYVRGYHWGHEIFLRTCISSKVDHIITSFEYILSACTIGNIPCTVYKLFVWCVRIWLVFNVCIVI